MSLSLNTRSSPAETLWLCHTFTISESFPSSTSDATKLTGHWTELGSTSLCPPWFSLPWTIPNGRIRFSTMCTRSVKS